MRHLECGDCIFLLEHVAQFIDAFQQAVFRKAINYELDLTAARKRDRLGRELDFHGCSGRRQQLRVSVGRDNHRQ